MDAAIVASKTLLHLSKIELLMMLSLMNNFWVWSIVTEVSLF